MKQSSGKQELEYEKPQALRFDGRRAGAGQCLGAGSGDIYCYIVGNAAGIDCVLGNAAGTQCATGDAVVGPP